MTRWRIGRLLARATFHEFRPWSDLSDSRLWLWSYMAAFPGYPQRSRAVRRWWSGEYFRMMDTQRRVRRRMEDLRHDGDSPVRSDSDLEPSPGGPGRRP